MVIIPVLHEQLYHMGPALYFTLHALPLGIQRYTRTLELWTKRQTIEVNLW